MPEKIRTGRAAALLSVGYAVAGYLLTLGVLVYTIGFLARWGVPKNIDSAAGAPWRPRWPSTPRCCCCSRSSTRSWPVARSSAGRPGCSARTPSGPDVVATGAALVTLLAAWQPLPAVLWRLTGPAAVTMHAVFAAGWLVALGATFTAAATPTFSGCGRPGGTCAAGSTNHPSSPGAACTPGSGTR